MKRRTSNLNSPAEKREKDRDHYNSYVRRPSTINPIYLRKPYEPIKKQGA
jgi:hypothetical protein